MRGNFYDNMKITVDWWFGTVEELDEEIEKNRNIGLVVAFIFLLATIFMCAYFIIIK